MFRRIGLLKGAAGQIFLPRLIFDSNALRRGKDVRLAIGLKNVGVARQRPESLHSVCRHRPVDRVFAAKPGETGMRHTVGIAVVIGDIQEPVVTLVLDHDATS